MSNKYKIDTSHSEIHSMDVLHFANSIYESEISLYPILKQQTDVIYTAAVLHDMCDKKYMNTDEGLDEIQKYFGNEINENDLFHAKNIMKTMSYSYVKKNGYPDLGDYQMAYNLVREADLLSSYDFDRSIIYHLNKGNTLTESYSNALDLFENRVFKYNSDKLLTYDYSIRISKILTSQAHSRINSWNRILFKK
jgi:HD superfamily phosphodiesterase